jgi:hypothetical protein
MSYCEHCQGQRFDRARVLRALRQARNEVRRKSGPADAEHALVFAMNTIRAMEIPHLELVEPEDEIVH